jgi:hypothetical protein
MSRTRSQCEQIWDALCRGESLTVAEALTRYGCYALSQRIGELKEKHPQIESEWVDTAGGARVKRYFLRQLELA